VRPGRLPLGRGDQPGDVDLPARAHPRLVDPPRSGRPARSASRPRVATVAPERVPEGAPAHPWRLAEQVRDTRTSWRDLRPWQAPGRATKLVIDGHGYIGAPPGRSRFSARSPRSPGVVTAMLTIFYVVSAGVGLGVGVGLRCTGAAGPMIGLGIASSVSRCSGCSPTGSTNVWYWRRQPRLGRRHLVLLPRDLRARRRRHARCGALRLLHLRQLCAAPLARGRLCTEGALDDRQRALLGRRVHGRPGTRPTRCHLLMLGSCSQPVAPVVAFGPGRHPRTGATLARWRSAPVPPAPGMANMQVEAVPR